MRKHMQKRIKLARARAFTHAHMDTRAHALARSHTDTQTRTMTSPTLSAIWLNAVTSVCMTALISRSGTGRLKSSQRCTSATSTPAQPQVACTCMHACARARTTPHAQSQYHQTPLMSQRRAQATQDEACTARLCAYVQYLELFSCF